MQQFTKNPGATFDVYVAETQYTDQTFKDGETLCYSGANDGLISCEGTGRYIIWQLKEKTNDTEVGFSELSAFDAKPLGSIAAGDTVTVTGLTIYAWMNTDRLIGPSDSNTNCI